MSFTPDFADVKGIEAYVLFKIFSGLKFYLNPFSIINVRSLIDNVCVNNEKDIHGVTTRGIHIKYTVPKQHNK